MIQIEKISFKFEQRPRFKKEKLNRDHSINVNDKDR